MLLKLKQLEATVRLPKDGELRMNTDGNELVLAITAGSSPVEVEIAQLAEDLLDAIYRAYGMAPIEAWQKRTQRPS